MYSREEYTKISVKRALSFNDITRLDMKTVDPLCLFGSSVLGHGTLQLFPIDDISIDNDGFDDFVQTRKLLVKHFPATVNRVIEAKKTQVSGWGLYVIKYKNEYIALVQLGGTQFQKHAICWYTDIEKMYQLVDDFYTRLDLVYSLPINLISQMKQEVHNRIHGRIRCMYHWKPIRNPDARNSNYTCWYGYPNRIALVLYDPLPTN